MASQAVSDQIPGSEEIRSGQQTAANDNLTKDGLPKSVKKNGTFRIPWECGKRPSVIALFQFLFLSKNNSNIPAEKELDKTLPIMTPDHAQIAKPPESGVQVTWIGHATSLVQIDGISVLTDPIFSTRCSISQYFGPKRYRKAPCTIKELPNIDAVVISHNHYDHLDYYSVKDLNDRFGEKLRWFVPLGLDSWMKSMGCKNVKEMDWWEEDSIPEKPDIKFVFTPAQHWCKRTATDDNKVLWGSWCVIGPWSRFFFAGDTGYCGVFKKIGKKYGPFDLSAIPIGAYEPRWFMKMQHVDPEEAVQIHKDLNSKKSLGVHWGTFSLANEYYLEPPKKLQETLSKEGLSLEDFFTVNIGETKFIGENYNTMD